MFTALLPLDFPIIRMQTESWMMFDFHDTVVLNDEIQKNSV